jgi:hypothetical protein
MELTLILEVFEKFAPRHPVYECPAINTIFTAKTQSSRRNFLTKQLTGSFAFFAPLR